MCRLGRHIDDGTLDLRAADATRMPFEDDSFDAVFESGMVHHVTDWRATLGEVSRVLKPGGSFCFAEPSRGRLQRGLYRLLPHAAESMFNAEELSSALAEVGLGVEGPIRRLPLWDICGVAVALALSSWLRVFSRSSEAVPTAVAWSVLYLVTSRRIVAVPIAVAGKVL